MELAPWRGREPSSLRAGEEELGALLQPWGGEEDAGVEGAWRPWEAPACWRAAVVGEENRLLQPEGEGGREWRLGNFEGWECKTAKGKGEGSVFIEKP